MSILDSLRRAFKRSFHPRDPEYWAKKLWGGMESKSGVSVDEDSAMTYSAYSAGIRIISETIASMPLNIYENLGEKGKRKAANHPLQYLLHDSPNEDMDAFTWRETAKVHVLGWGNHYSFLTRNPLKRYITSIYPMEPWRVKPEIIKTPSLGRIKVYKYMPEEGPEYIINKEDVLHIHGLSYNGLIGVTPLTWYREQVGLGLAMEEYSARFFSNGTNATGVFTTDQVLKPDTYEKLKEQLKKNYAGLGKSHSSMLLEQGVKFDKISINPNDAQLLESKKFQVEEIARILRIPLHLLQSLEHASDNNIEHLGINFVVYCLLPWLKRDEQAYNMQLFMENEKGRFFTKYVVDGLLRGDTAARWESYVKAIQNGVYTPNDVLEMEDHNPYEGGDKHFIQLNMQTVEELGKQLSASRRLIINAGEVREIKSEVGEIKSIESNSNIKKELLEKLSGAYKPLFFNAFIRIIKREKVDINKLIKNLDPEMLSDELKNYYQKHSDFVITQVKPPIYAFTQALFEAVFESNNNKQVDIDVFSISYAEDFTKRYINNNLSELEGEPAETISSKLDLWEQDKPEELSTNEMNLILALFNKYIEKI